MKDIELDLDVQDKPITIPGVQYSQLQFPQTAITSGVHMDAGS